MSDASTPETAGDLQIDSHAVETGAGAGGTGQEHQENSHSHEVEVVEGSSGAGVPVIKLAPVYNKQGVVEYPGKR